MGAVYPAPFPKYIIPAPNKVYLKGAELLLDQNKEEFLKIYKENIHRPGSDTLLEWLENSDFFTAPASTRFHGSYAGGLLEHSLNVYHCLQREVHNHAMEDEYTPETIAVSALLHDVCKVNFYKQGFRNAKDENGKWYQKPVYEIDERFPCGHGEKSVIILQSHMRLAENEIYAIRAHMGGFDTSVKGGDRFIGEIFERCPLSVLLHIADMKATYLVENSHVDK